MSSSTPSYRLEHRHFAEIDSTHAWVERNYGQLDPSRLTLISADFQTAGRGTGGRQWAAPNQKSALCTFYFTLPDRLKGQAASFLQVAALSFLGTLRKRVCFGLEKTGLDFRLKWPNDLMLNGKKVGGILSRMVINPGRHHAVNPSAAPGGGSAFAEPMVSYAEKGFSPFVRAGNVPQRLDTNISWSGGGPVWNAEPAISPPSSPMAAARSYEYETGSGYPSRYPAYDVVSRTYNDGSHSPARSASGKNRVGLIVSVGININSSPTEIRSAAACGGSKFVWPPTSLKQEVGNPTLDFDIAQIKELLVSDLDATIARFERDGYEGCRGRSRVMGIGWTNGEIFTSYFLVVPCP